MKVAVIGGGLLGSCIAMELARRGETVDLYEKRAEIMGAASRNNEGKIHLGYVYAADSSLRTALLQMKGAAQFSALLRGWLGNIIDAAPISTRFHYVIHEKSALAPHELRRAYDSIGALMRSVIPNGAYFGIARPWEIEPLSQLEVRNTYGPAVREVVATREVAIDPFWLSAVIRDRIEADPKIRVVLEADIISVDAWTRTLEVRGRSPTIAGPYDHVVNCAWEGRVAIDSGLGLHPREPWSFRMKYFVRLEGTGAEIPSATIVSGLFGDVVDYRNGQKYLCWYPVGRRGFSTDISPPNWPRELPSSERDAFVDETTRGLVEVIPGIPQVIDRSRHLEVNGGVIYALGDTDIDDPASRLHQRIDVGTQSMGWYHSVDTGKYTMAPMFAVQAADKVTGAK